MLESSTALCNYSIKEIGILGREWRGDKDYIRLELNTSFFFIGNIKYNIHLFSINSQSTLTVSYTHLTLPTKRIV